MERENKKKYFLLTNGIANYQLFSLPPALNCCVTWEGGKGIMSFETFNSSKKPKLHYL